MLELFSRKPDGIVVPADVILTPIPTDSDMSSLSAILLDDAYYDWVMAGRRTAEGVRVVGAEHLIPLKARAFLDLSARRLRGERVDRKDVNKHRSDVVRLAGLLTAVPLENEIPDVIRGDIRQFVDGLQLSVNDLKDIRGVIRDPSQLVSLLRTVYGLEE